MFLGFPRLKSEASWHDVIMSSPASRVSRLTTTCCRSYIRERIELNLFAIVGIPANSQHAIGQDMPDLEAFGNGDESKQSTFGVEHEPPAISGHPMPSRVA